jgi:hypothetical protein
MSDRKLLPGKFVWFEHVSRDARKAQAFHGEVLGWKTQGFPMGEATYEMVCAASSGPPDVDTSRTARKMECCRCRRPPAFHGGVCGKPDPRRPQADGGAQPRYLLGTQPPSSRPRTALEHERRPDFLHLDESKTARAAV